MVAASDRSKGEMKMIVPMKTKNRRGRRKEKMATAKRKKGKEKKVLEKERKKWWGEENEISGLESSLKIRKG